MRKTFTIICIISLFFAFVRVQGQSYLIGPVDPFVGTNANYTTHNHYNLFDVMNPDGIYIDSLTIYPQTAQASYTVVIQNSSQVQIASSSGTTTVGGNQAERIEVNLFVPQGTGYRMGLTTTSVGMLRNQDGILFPYTVPNVISFTGATFGTTYWYFFYNLRVSLPVYESDAALTELVSPADTICSGFQPVSVTMKNFGPSDIIFADLHWSVNGVPQPVHNWSGSLGVLDTVTFVIGEYDFQPGITYDIVANVSEPNGITDTITHNDTTRGSVEFVMPSPEIAVTSAGVITICQGDSIELTGTLTGTPPWHLTIDDGTTAHQFTGIQSSPFSFPFHPATTTTYIITSLLDSTGCIMEPYDTVQVHVIPQPPADITPVSPSEICEGDSIVLMGSLGAAFSYQWFKDDVILPADTNYAFIAKEAGSYTVIVTNPLGCSKLSDPHILTVNPLPEVFIGNDTAVLPNVSLLLDAGEGFESYNWSTGENTQTINVDSSGIGIGVKTVWVEVTDDKNCVGTDTIKINFTPNPGIEEKYHEVKLFVFPNPTSGFATLEMTQLPADKYKVEIFSQNGQQVYVKEVTTNQRQEQFQLDLSNMADGIYLLLVRGNNVFLSEKILLNRNQ